MPAPSTPSADDPDGSADTIVTVNLDALGRRSAAVAGHVGDEATARVRLRDASAATRATALGAIARLGALDAATVEGALVDPSPVVRRRAATLAIPFAIDLVGLLADRDGLVAETAAWALGERADQAGPAAVASLAAVVVDHADPLVREAAVAALGAIGDPAGLDAVLAACTDKPAVRRRAVLALAAFEGPERDAAVERALEDRDWQVRQAAEDVA